MSELKIIICDDNEDYAFCLVELFDLEFGIKVDYELTSSDLLKRLLREDDYDLIVLDYNFPGDKNGISTAKMIRNTLEIQTPILILTGYFMEFMNRYQNDLSNVRFVSKTIHVEELLEKFRSMIGENIYERAA